MNTILLTGLFVGHVIIGFGTALLWFKLYEHDRTVAVGTATVTSIVHVAAWAFLGQRLFTMTVAEMKISVQVVVAGGLVGLGAAAIWFRPDTENQRPTGNHQRRHRDPAEDQSDQLSIEELLQNQNERSDEQRNTEETQ